MKLICPDCGLGGTADTVHYGKKVRCPGCGIIFRVSDEVIFEPSSLGAVEQSILKGDQDQERENNSIDVPAEDLTESGVDLEDPNLGECSRCGFSFSKNFLKRIEDLPVCPVCVNG